MVAIALSRRGAEAKEREQRATVLDRGPTVRLADVELSASDRTLSIPGEVRAWAQSTLYSKVAGYVREVKVDKGTPVKKGQLLAGSESPETDQQVLGARADLQVKQAQTERLRKLRPQGFIAQQDLDNAEGALSVARATLQSPGDAGIRAAQGAVRRSGDRALRGPGRAGGGGDGVEPVAFAGRSTWTTPRPGAGLRRTGRCGRHPQRRSRRNQPPRTIRAIPSRPPSPALRGNQAHTRTMLVEVDVPNEPVRLYPRAATWNVKIRFPGRRTQVVPGEALAWRGDSLYVARLDVEDRVKLIRIQPGRADGRRVQVLPAFRAASGWCSTRAPSFRTVIACSRSPKGGGPAAGR